MKSLILTIFFVYVILFGTGRIINSLLYHDNATILIASEYCVFFGGEKIDQYCQITADVSYRLITGNHVIRTKDGRIMDLSEGTIISMAWKDSHYGFSWD